MPLLNIENMTVTYSDGAEALRGVSLAVEPGRKVGLIGPNGSGKTTLLLAVMGGVPFEGSVTVDEVVLSPRRADDVRSRCGMTFQDADDQLFMPTLLEDAAFGPLNQGLTGPEAKDRAEAAIAAVGLSGLEPRSAHHLSGGQKRLAALATVLSMQVKLLLLDEPGANLDVRSRTRLADVLAGRDEAMLLATHDLELIAKLCTDVVLLDEGRVMTSGAVSEILSDTDLLGTHGLA